MMSALRRSTVMTVCPSRARRAAVASPIPDPAPVTAIVPILAFAFLASCATTPDFPPPNDLWESFTGQLQYITPERSIIGEFTAARHGDDFRLEFSKGGAVTLLKLAQHDGLLRAVSLREALMAVDRAWNHAGHEFNVGRVTEPAPVRRSA